MPLGLADNFDRVFTLFEINADSVPIFRRFLLGESLTIADVAELAKATRELGFFNIAETIAHATPETMNAIAQAGSEFERVRKMGALWDAFFR